MTARGKLFDVNDFMANLDHPLKSEVEAIRAIVKDADLRLTERIKWNAPSYGYDGEDRVTFILHARDRVQIVFHRGAKPKESALLQFEDGTGLLKWVAPDRAIAAFRTMDDVSANREALADLVRRWVAATA
jgi:uncharacterized protein YdhG (YjbR/CyaY superfamily)